MINNLIWAFIIGGGICTIGQVVMNFTNMTNGKILVLFLLLGGILQAFGLYEPLIDSAGAGASVPISGFGYALVKGAVEATETDGFIGAISGAMQATALGISCAIVSGYTVAVVSKPKTKEK